MYINNIGYNHFHNADFCIHRPLGSGDYLFVLLKTPAVFILVGQEVAADENSFVLFEKGTPQHYRACGTQFSNDWFHFDIQDGEKDFFRELDIPFDKAVPLCNINDISLLIKNMCYENYSSNTYKADSTELYMKLLFIKLSEKIHSGESRAADSYYEKLSILRSKIYNMPHHKWNVKGLADSLTISRSYFQHMYKATFGISVMNDVIKSRIEHSKYLLTATDLTVGKIAELCGYSGNTHFMRQFKENMNMTPSEYRELIKNPEHK